MPAWAVPSQRRYPRAAQGVRFLLAVALWHGFRWASAQLLGAPWLAALAVETGLDQWESAEAVAAEGGAAFASEVWHRLRGPGGAALVASWPLVLGILSVGVVPLWWALRAVGAGSRTPPYVAQLGRLWTLGWVLAVAKGGLIALSLLAGATVRSVLLAYEDPRWASGGSWLIALGAGLGVLLLRTTGDIAYAAVVDRDANVAAAAEVGLSACLRRPLKYCGLCLCFHGGAVALAALALASLEATPGFGPAQAAERLLAAHLCYCTARTAWLFFALRAAREQCGNPG